ncbi:MAG: 4Fe-4S ferredoxin [Desulfobacterales bacterium CG07_land_8_20_14_0_80_52_14]|nr:MAG: 4Fe-4S ferredoxin [Desulfobacterales bacterium CG23_combo_of_CG06-09_8_20_14_all_52_9]PIU50422.1 MAG: 4Fe-4S ferredoxin [Desulfobacterales bacterium CG07_land_8_20_14_0_80_52_14]
MDEVYKRLAGHLNTLPGGFPPTDAGLEIRILERLFTPEEAAAAVHLTMNMESPETIAARAQADLGSFAGLLETMSKKGLILRSFKRGEPLYMAAQFMVGIWEYHVNTLDVGLIEDVNAYLPYLLQESWIKPKTKQLRVIPVSASIRAEMKIMPYEAAEAIIESQSKIVVAPCICRKEHAMMGKGCGRPLETCLIFGGSAHYYEQNHLGRSISKKEALSILKQGMDAGLVLQPGNAKKPTNICMCCGCCCQILNNLKKLDKPALAVCSGYRATVNGEICTTCGTCVIRCPMDAVIIEDVARIDEDRCIGCGVCVATCESGALKLIAKAEDERWVPPENIAETYFRIASERRGKTIK